MAVLIKSTLKQRLHPGVTLFRDDPGEAKPRRVDSQERIFYNLFAIIFYNNLLTAKLVYVVKFTVLIRMYLIRKTNDIY